MVRRLRRAQTDAEMSLWKVLRNRHLTGSQFRRQHEFGPYILDFYCPGVRLAVEADGSQHPEAAGLVADEERRPYLESRGVSLVRFTDTDILNEPEAVLEQLLARLEGTPSP